MRTDMRTTKKMAVRRPDDVWEAFRHDAEGLPEVAIGEVGSKETVKRGCFVWVIPARLTPNEARDGEGHTMELKEILNIYYHPTNKKFLYECRDYIRGPEVDQMLVDYSDPATTALLKCLGAPDEYVWTDIHTYVWSNRIEDLVEISFLDPCSAGFRPLLPHQPYTRYDLELEMRRKGNSLEVGARRAPMRVCKPDCKQGGAYHPHVDHMRWCQTCKTWFHIGCLEEGNMRCPFLASFHIPGERSDNWHLWEDACNAAITRIPRTDDLYHTTLFTLETILYEIKDKRNCFWLAADKELPDFTNFVLGIMADQDLGQFNWQLYRDLLNYMEFMKMGMVYHCGNKDCYHVRMSLRIP